MNPVEPKKWGHRTLKTVTLKPETIAWHVAYEKIFLRGNCKFFVTDKRG